MTHPASLLPFPAVIDDAWVQDWRLVGLTLCECKREGLPWEQAWFQAMRRLSPEKTTGHGPEIREALAQERDLQRELRSYYQAAYEDRDETAEEFEARMQRTEKRLDQVLVPA